MATDISLHNYLKKLNQLLEENRYPEVVLHAQHILKHFSRHVPTYLLLGQALLEQQDFSGAIDLLQRVLSARPNEFVAHLGLSIAYSEEGLYPQAMWHLLRANEMDPYNTNIQRELRELYRQQRGEYLPEIPISQASLARLHFKGGQYPQAIAALRQSLAEADEDRVDLELLLAESLWRNKQRIEAAEICDGILKKLPNCIMANAILAEIYLQGEQPNQATEHLQLVQTLTQIDQAQLDVSTAVGAAFSVPTATTLPQEIRLPQLEENGLNGTFGMGEDDSTPTIADWISDFGLDEDINREDDLYDWLHPADKTTEETAVTEPEPSWLEDNLENELEPIQLAPDQLDEWNISPTDETVFAAPAAETVDETEDIPGWLQNISPTQSPDAEAVHEEGVPDWLQPSSANDNADFVANLNEQFDVMEDSVTDNNKGKKPKKVADDAQENSMDDALSWLDDLIGQDTADSTETQAPKAASPQEEALPDWLKDLSTKQAEPDAIPNDDLPDWLKEAALTTETALPGVLDADDLSETTTPSMGDDSGLNEVVEAEIAPIDTDLSWLDELTTESAEHDDLITMTWQDEPESEPAADAEAEPQSFDEAMAWLEDLAAEQSTPIEEPPTVAQGLFGTEILKPETAVSEPANSELDEAMAWLDELASEEPEATLADATREATNQALETDVAAASPQDTMTWLDELAANQEALIEENAEAPIDNNLADALDWLEAQTEETTPESGNEAMTEALDFELETPTVSVQRPLEMPEDPDEALAWLEQLAADTYQTDSVSTETTVSGVVETAVSDTEPAIEELETVPSTTEASLLDVPEDPDEAMAWLEQLAANQGAPLDELPSLQASATLENEPDANEAVEPADDLDDAMAWLEELTQDQDNVQETLEGAAPIAAVESIAENMAEAADVAEEEQLDGIDLHAVPEDPDEAMAWLEQLAARQGAPIDELPSLHETSEETAVEAVDSPAVDEPAAAETDNDLDGDPMAWLEELMQDEDILAEEAGTLEDIPDFLADAEQENETVAPTVEETETVDLEAADVSEPPEDLDDAMAWLEQLAANQGASLDELPSLQDTPEVGEETAVVAEVAPEAPVEEIEATESENAEVSEPPEDLDDAMAWLEQLAADQGASLDELPSLQDAPEVGEETAVVAEVAPEAPVEEIEIGEPEVSDVSEPPDDLDDAMAWLEQLAANQGASLDELPSLQDAPEVGEETAVVAAAAPEAPVEEIEMAEPETAEVNEPPEDLDDAMAWLEQLAANQGASLDELPSLQDAPEVGEETAVVAEDTAEAAVEEIETTEPETTDESETPDALDGAMAWLEQLAAEQGASFDEPSSLAATDDATVGLVADEASLEMEDLSDDPMAWLDELATEQGIDLESTEAEEETAVFEATGSTPLVEESNDSVAAVSSDDAGDDVSHEEAPEAAAEAVDEVDNALAWLDELATDDDLFAEADDSVEASTAVESASHDSAIEEAETVATDTAEAETDTSLPDWLPHEPAPTSIGDTGWLKAIAEPDVADWLTSEEKASTGTLEQDGFGTDALDSILEPEPLSEPALEVPVVEEPRSEPVSVLDVDEDQLSVARSAVERGDVQTAVVSYQSLLNHGDGLSLLIAELENATTQAPQQPKLHQLLGDAYLQNGQLQKALGTYRDALNAL